MRVFLTWESSSSLCEANRYGDDDDDLLPRDDKDNDDKGVLGQRGDDMGDDNEKVCPYCSTLYVHDASLSAQQTVPEGCLLVDEDA